MAKIDIYQVVTDSLVSLLEKGRRPWVKPWDAPAGHFGAFGALPLRSNGKPYQGINIWILWARSEEKGYTNARWITLKQANKLGGKVRKGEKGTMVVKWTIKDLLDKTSGKPITDGKGQPKKIFFASYSTVFNVEQCEKLPERFFPKPVEKTEAEVTKAKLARIDHAEQYFKNIGAEVRHGGSSAFFSPSSDHIQMPEFEKFHSAEHYYSTEAHEHGHWTGAEKRLNREFGKRFGDDAYAMEELVAEMTAAFVGALLGMPVQTREDHADYMAHWIKVLKADNKAIFTASSAAQKATDYLNNAAGFVMPAADEAEEDEMKEAA